MNKSKKSRATMTASGVAALQNVYYDKKVLENLKAQTPFMSLSWDCACGSPATNMWSVNHLPLCDGCSFRRTVMQAAGREEEFWEDYKAKRGISNPAGSRRRKPLPVKSGKTIQMYTYKPLVSNVPTPDEEP